MLRLESEPTQTIVRRSLIEGKTNPVPRNKETFSATARQWCMINIDSFEWDANIQEQKAILAHAVQQLLSNFQSVDCWGKYIIGDPKLEYLYRPKTEILGNETASVTGSYKYP